VFFLALIKLFYSYRYFLHDRYAFVSLISLFIIIPVIYIDSRAVFFRSTVISRSANLSYFKSFSIIFNKRPAGVTSDIGDDSEFLKCSCKLVNPSDRVYIAFFRRFFY
jgi:hypothetical protein